MQLPLDKLLHFSAQGRQAELNDSPEGMFLADAISAYLDIRSPFDGVLEAPESVIRAHEQHAADISLAAENLRLAIRPVLEEVHAALPPR